MQPVKMTLAAYIATEDFKRRLRRVLALNNQLLKSNGIFSEDAEDVIYSVLSDALLDEAHEQTGCLRDNIGSPDWWRWFFIACEHRSIDRLRFHTRQKKPVFVSVFHLDTDDKQPSPLDELIGIEETRRLTDQIETLPEPQKAILKLWLSGFPECEISNSLGLSRGQVQRQLRKAKDRLKEFFSDQTSVW